MANSEMLRVSSVIYKKYLENGSLWSNSVRNKINASLKKTPPSTLWHYCSSETFEKICNSGHIYLSDLNSMNDYQEGRWLREKIMHQVEKEARCFAPFLEASRAYFTLGPFVGSLSEEGDLLSQWRAYASGGQGVAMGLNSKKLSIPLFQADAEQLPGYTALCSVIYDEKIQDEITNNIVCIIKKIIAEVGEEKFKIETHPFVMASAYINIYLQYIEPVFKNPAFKEEKEWRIIHFPKSTLLNTWKSDADVVMSDKEEAENIQFRTTKNDIIPYFSFPKNNNLNEIVTNINFGPLNIMKNFHTALFLQKNGFRNYRIGKSSATLR